MKTFLVALAVLGMVVAGVSSTPAQNSGTETPVPVAELPQAEVMNNPPNGSSSQTDCDGDVCVQRAPDCTSAWNGVRWCALLPAIQGGDVVPRVAVKYNRQAILNGVRIEFSACRNMRWGVDQHGFDYCWITWEVHPQELGLREDRWYRISGRDRNRCFSTQDTHGFYTNARGFVPGDRSHQTESSDMRTERECS